MTILSSKLMAVGLCLNSSISVVVQLQRKKMAGNTNARRGIELYVNLNRSIFMLLTLQISFA
jgi:hypothetical protein